MERWESFLKYIGAENEDMLARENTKRNGSLSN